MVIRNRLRFFTFFFFFVLSLFIAVKSCVGVSGIKNKYVEVEADKVSPVPEPVENSKALVNFIEEVKETSLNDEKELSLAEIERKEKEEQEKNSSLSKTSRKKVRPSKAKPKKILPRKVAKKSTKRLSPRKSAIPAPQTVTVSGGEKALNGFSRARLESYARTSGRISSKKIKITGFYLSGESKLEGFKRAEKIKKVLLSSGLKNKTIYVSSRPIKRSPSSANYDWGRVSAF